MILKQGFLFVAFFGVSLAEIYKGNVTDEYKRCTQHPPRLQEGGYVSVADEEYDWECIQQSYLRNADFHGINRTLSDADKEYFRGLLREISTAVKRQANGGRCTPLTTRKEYRTMTDAERTAFHNCLQTLKTQGRYDTLAALHVGNPGAHRGPAFLNWHRIYLQMMERALKRVNPECMLPYWASAWDNEMVNPTASIMWDNSFAGNGFGAVTTGPAANWGCLGGALTRNIGRSGGLITHQEAQNVIAQDWLVQISTPFAAPQNNLERHHDKVHGWVGGHMGSLASAPCDPVFYMHHAYIDCIYEAFRLRQIEENRNPDTDWPETTQPAHAEDFPISLDETLTNIDVSKRAHACANYEPTCAQFITCDCDRPCPTRYLTCDRQRSICIPVERPNVGNEPGSDQSCQSSNNYAYGGGPSGGNRYIPYRGPDNYRRPQYGPSEYSSGGNSGVQNTYCISGERCGTEYWSYIPIQINTYRPPNQDNYNSYPVVKGRVDRQYDIYDPRGYGQTSVYANIRQGQSQSPAYQNCGCRSTAGGVYVQSYGNTYEGSYREYQPIDYRVPVSSTTSYVAVMNPQYGRSESYIRVYDECGRTCRPRCRYTGTTEYEDCEGIVGIQGNPGEDYANTYAQATELLYSSTNRGNGRYTMTYSPENINIIYDCDYRGGWPWPQQGEQTYDRYNFRGNLTYEPPVYPDPDPYPRRLVRGYY